MKSKSGFTIIEVLVVIGIIAILTVLIFPSITQIRAKNRDAEKVADIAAIQLALSLFYNKTGGYPTDLNDTLLNTNYLPADSLVSPVESDPYMYVPLKRGANATKCTYYHLGVKLELQSAQIDPRDKTVSLLNSTQVANATNARFLSDEGYSLCGTGTGIDGTAIDIYDVHP
ncbi:MAG: type II secretion system protein [Candidatus Paceibacterota bacterium]